MNQNAAALVGSFGATPYSEFFIKETPPAPEHSSLKIRRFTDLFYKTEHEAHVRVGDHPRIVRYYGWDNRGLLFEKHNGGDLISCLLTQRDSPPSLTDRFQWASDVAEGMAFLHSKGVIWVDVSMSNVLLSDDHRRALICDLGGASILPMPGYKPLPAAYKDTTVCLHPMIGLPHYPNSHVWDGPGHDNYAEISPHQDRFGYGLMLFCLLTLHFPHSRFLTIHDLNEANQIATLQYDKQFDTLGNVPEYAAFECIIQKCFHAEYRSSDDLEAEVKVACAAMDKDNAPLLQDRVQDPVIQFPRSTGRSLFPFTWEKDDDYEDGIPDYDAV
ncbi:kinase-like domain-containing protein [Mycena haematopus]|nr:kinase-like domain-containing protein [Mycena haematopus]